MTVYRSTAAIPAVAGRAGVAGVAAAGRVGVAVRELPDSSTVVRLTRGRLWIGVLGSLLAGIVALNVISLGLTSVSGQTGVQIDQLQRDNSALHAEIAEKLSATRIQSAAPGLGLSVPPPADITYLNYAPSDLARAAKVIAGEVAVAAEPWTPSSQSGDAVPSGTTSIQPVPSTDSTTSSPVTSTSTSSSSSSSASTPTSASPAPAAPSAPSPSSGGSSGGVGTGL